MLRHFGPPLAVTALLISALLLVAWLGRRGRFGNTWRAIKSHPVRVVVGAALVFALVAFYTFLIVLERNLDVEARERQDLTSSHNSLPNPTYQPSNWVQLRIQSWEVEGKLELQERGEGYAAYLGPSSVLTSSMVQISGGLMYRYSIWVLGGQTQLQFRWYSKTLEIISWYDTPPFQARLRLGNSFLNTDLITPAASAD